MGHTGKKSCLCLGNVYDTLLFHIYFAQFIDLLDNNKRQQEAKTNDHRQRLVARGHDKDNKFYKAADKEAKKAYERISVIAHVASDYVNDKHNYRCYRDTCKYHVFKRSYVVERQYAREMKRAVQTRTLMLDTIIIPDMLFL